MLLVHNAPNSLDEPLARIGFQRAHSKPWHNFHTDAGDPEFSGLVGLNREDLFADMDNVEFDEAAATAAVQTLCLNLKEARQKWPRAKMGLYNMPLLAYWFGQQIPLPPNNRTWWNATEEEAEACMAFFERINAPLIDAVDWLAPSEYDPYDANHPQEADIAYMRARVRFARRMAGTSGKPVIGYCWPVNKGTNGAPMRLMTPEEFIGGQVTAALDEGADGIFLWGGWTSEILNACRPTLPVGHGDAAAQQRARAFFLTAYFAPNGHLRAPSDWTAIKGILTEWIEDRVLTYARHIAVAVGNRIREQQRAEREAANQAARAARQTVS